MIDRLRSHLHNEKGFTLIELLVVIAIIAILVVIVVVAINPVQRLNDARDRTAQSNVRAAGTLISTCVTQALVASGTGWEAACDTEAEVENLGSGTWPTGVTAPTAGAAAGDNDVCVGQAGGANYYVYRHSTGTTTATSGTGQPVGWCP